MTTIAFSRIMTNNSHMIHDIFPKVVAFGALHLSGAAQYFWCCSQCLNLSHYM